MKYTCPNGGYEKAFIITLFPKDTFIFFISLILYPAIFLLTNRYFNNESSWILFGNVNVTLSVSTWFADNEYENELIKKKKIKLWIFSYYYL